MRGKPRCAPYSRSPSGITPACAGKTERMALCSNRGWDHPRVCGENFTLCPVAHHNAGSPPRVRGKLHDRGHTDRAGGITPACAGKTSLFLSGDCRLGDHPRVCGENLIVFLHHIRARGSPPRVRGKRRGEGAAHSRLGITPACAGKTFESAVNCGHIRDHPRVCGENLAVRNAFS